MIDHLVAHGMERSSPSPERPPEPEHEPLLSVSGVAFEHGGAKPFTVLFEDDPKASDEALIVAEQGGPVDLRRWR